MLTRSLLFNALLITLATSEQLHPTVISHNTSEGKTITTFSQKLWHNRSQGQAVLLFRFSTATIEYDLEKKEYTLETLQCCGTPTPVFPSDTLEFQLKSLQKDRAISSISILIKDQDSFKAPSELPKHRETNQEILFLANTLKKFVATAGNNSKNLTIIVRDETTNDQVKKEFESLASLTVYFGGVAPIDFMGGAPVDKGRTLEQRYRMQAELLEVLGHIRLGTIPQKLNLTPQDQQILYFLDWIARDGKARADLEKFSESNLVYLYLQPNELILSDRKKHENVESKSIPEYRETLHQRLQEYILNPNIKLITIVLQKKNDGHNELMTDESPLQTSPVLEEIAKLIHQEKIHKPICVAFRAETTPAPLRALFTAAATQILPYSRQLPAYFMLQHFTCGQCALADKGLAFQVQIQTLHEAFKLGLIEKSRKQKMVHWIDHWLCS